MRPVALFVLLVACGRGAGSSPAPKRDDGGGSGAASASEQAPVVAPLALGLTAIDGFGYRKRPGQPAFRRARESEAAGKWAEVATACRESLATDPAHLDAAYLLAVALAKTDAAPAAIVTPLTTAVSGDLVKWGAAALAQPALQRFLATPLGTAWQARLAEARARLATILSRDLVVGAHGDLYVFDRRGGRFVRLTRTGGAVIATFRTSKLSKLVYLTRERRKGTSETKVGVGLVDLAAGRSKKLAYLASVSETLRLAFNRKVNGFIVYSKGWFAIEDATDVLALRALPAKEHAGYPANLADMTWLDVRGRSAVVRRTQLPNIAADVDSDQLASALKIDSTKRVVTVPSPALIDTTTVAWSPDRSQLALVARLSDDCKPDAPTTAVLVVDAATGAARELARATRGMAVEWVADRLLAIAGDTGVTIHRLVGDPAPTAIPGVDALVQPRRMPDCAAAAIDEVADGTEEPEPPEEPEESDAAIP